MSLLQPHSSPDKAADYTTCSGKRIVRVCLHVHVCVCVSSDPKRSSANRTLTCQECTFSDKHTITHRSPGWIYPSHTRPHTPTELSPWSHFSHAHTRPIKCDWVSKPLNESGWLGPRRAGLTFPSTSSFPCACVFLWVSGCELSGLRHFTSNVTDLNEMARETGWRRREGNIRRKH